MRSKFCRTHWKVWCMPWKTEKENLEYLSLEWSGLELEASDEVKSGSRNSVGKATNKLERTFWIWGKWQGWRHWDWVLLWIFLLCANPAVLREYNLHNRYCRLSLTLLYEGTISQKHACDSVQMLMNFEIALISCQDSIRTQIKNW